MRLNKITIEHSDKVSLLDAILAVQVAVKDGITRGHFCELSNGLGVDYRDDTKTPHYWVWRLYG